MRAEAGIQPINLDSRFHGNDATSQLSERLPNRRSPSMSINWATSTPPRSR